MSATERGADNPSDNTAISRAQPKEGEGNVRPVSLVQQIVSDPKALNLLRQAFHGFSMVHLRMQVLLRNQTLAERSRLTRQMKMTPLRISRRLKGVEEREMIPMK